MVSILAQAYQICGEVNGGTPVDTLINDEMNRGYAENPEDIVGKVPKRFDCAPTNAAIHHREFDMHKLTFGLATLVIVGGPVALLPIAPTTAATIV